MPAEQLLTTGEEGDSERPSDPAATLLIPLARSRWLLAGCVACGLAFGLAQGIMQPNTYQSTGKLMVRWGVREEATAESAVTDSSRGSVGASRDAAVNEIHLLSDPAVFERVARQVGVQDLYSSYDPTAMDDEETAGYLRLFHSAQAWWFGGGARAADDVGHQLDSCDACVRLAADSLQARFDLTAQPYSSVISVSFETHDPELARRVVTAFLDVAEARHMEVYDTGSTLGFLTEQLQDALASVRKTENAFTDYRLSCGTFDYDVQKASSLAEVERLNSLVAANDSRLVELVSRSQAIDAMLGTIPAKIVEPVERAPVPNPKWGVLQTRLMTLQDDLLALDTRLSGTTAEKDAERSLFETKIRRTEELLAEQPELLEQTPLETPVPNPRFTRLIEQLDTLSQEIVVAQAADEESHRRLELAREQLVTIEKCEPDYVFLEAQAQRARGRYDSFVKAHDQSSLMNLLDTMSLSNLWRIQEATLPMDKVGPRRAKLVLVGFLLGSVIGVVLAFVRNLIDPFVRNPAEARRALGVEVLGVVAREHGSRRRRLALQRAAL